MLTGMLVLWPGCGPGPKGPCDGMPPRGCQGLDYAYTCNNGIYQELHCQRDTVCVTGVCAAVICNVGDFQCDGAVATLCTSDGTVQSKDDCGAKGQKCVVEPLTAHCVAQTCIPMTTYCGGDEIRKCSADGLKYDVVQTCDDRDQRGRTCVGASCLDRCQLIEAHDRSTVGCNFLGVTSGIPTVTIGNLQTDLPATVFLTRSDGGSGTSITVPAGGTKQLSLPAETIAAGTGLGYGLRVASSVPVMVWLETAGQAGPGTILHPDHTLSTSYVGGVGSTRETVLVVAATASDVTIKVPVATDAGGTLAAVAAGGTLTHHLDAGQALSLQASTGALAGVRVDATAPVSVFIANPSPSVMPGIETLGRDFIVVRDVLLVAPTATMITVAGVASSIAAGGSRAVGANSVLSSVNPILMVQSGTVIPPTQQRRTTLFAPATGGGWLVAGAPGSAVTVGGNVTLQSVTGAGAVYQGPITRGIITSPQPLYGFSDTLGPSFGYGLDVLP